MYAARDSLRKGYNKTGEAKLSKGIFSWIKHAFWLIKRNILNAKIIENRVNCFAKMTKSNSAMMRITFFN